MNDGSETKNGANAMNNILLGPKTNLNIGAWNVRTMYETGKTEQVVKEMRRYNLDILCVSECRWTDSGSVSTATGEKIIYSGRKDNHHSRGVAIIMNKTAQKAMIEWEPIDERIITARFYSKYSKLTIIQCYSPTNDASEEEKKIFYDKLQSVISKVPSHDLLLLCGDLNAKVGNNNEGREKIMGKNGIGTINENGELFCNLCGLNDLVIGGTLFQHKDIHKLTWLSANRRDSNQIDHIAINGKWRHSLLDVKVKRGADCGSDHYLVVCKIRLKLKKSTTSQVTRKLYNTQKLKEPEVQQKFRLQLRNKFAALNTLENVENNTSESIENEWDAIKTVYNETAENVLGTRNRKRKEWISDSTWKAIEERKAIKQKLIQTKSERLKEKHQHEYTEKDKEVKTKAKADKQCYIDELGNEAEEAAKRGDLSMLYKINRKLCGKQQSTDKPVKNKDGFNITSQTEQLQRWAEHFKEVLNKESKDKRFHAQTFGEQLPIDLSEIRIEEIQTAVLKLKNGKSPGLDTITAELLKSDLETTTKVLKTLFDKIWKNEKIPYDWTKGIIVKLPKKGDLTLCDNWRGVTLLSIPGKVFLRIILDRINKNLDERLREEQAGFRKNKGCIDHIFTIRNIIEQATEWQSKTIFNFIDFRKAFDSINRDCLWKILKAYGLPEKIITLIIYKAFYNNYECSVIHNGIQTEWFEVNTGVRQGCIISPLLFITAIDWCMRTALGNKKTGIRWTMHSLLEDLDFADDICLISSSKQHMQLKTSSLENTARTIGLDINAKKTKIMTINNSCNTKIKIEKSDVEEVEEFTYLGSVVSKENGTSKDINSRISKARSAFCQLRPLWRSSKISLKTKIKIYNSNVKSILLYGAECWRLIQTDTQKLQAFHNTCLRKICKIFWPRKISNINLWKKTSQKDIETEIKQRRWRWIGHVLRLDKTNPANIALKWTPDGKRKRGRPKETWRRMVNGELKEMGLSWREAEQKAKDRRKWRLLTSALCVEVHEEE